MGEFYRFRRLKWAAPKRLPVLPRRAPVRTRRWLGSLWVPLIAFVLTMAAGAALLRADWEALGNSAQATMTAVAEAVAPQRFGPCMNKRQSTCVVDGDTFRLEGEIIRIADIDTPEVFDFQCASEKARGDRATRRLTALLNAGAFELEPIDRDTDQYGRSLRIVTRQGHSLGRVLVAEGLARQWDGARHPWC